MQISENKIEKENRNTNIRGLSRLVMNCFGKPLDKGECMSNWSNKPLRKAQMRYAALDAYVLIKIYDYLKEVFNVDFENINYTI
jgi:ribonuclease D